MNSTVSAPSRNTAKKGKRGDCPHGVLRKRALGLGSRFVVSSASPALERLFAVTGVTSVLREA